MAGLIAQRFRSARALIAFVTLMSFTAGVVTYLRYDIVVHGLPLPIFTGLLYAALIGTAALFTSIALPALRAMIEAAAISRLGVATVSFGLPEFGQALQHSPMLSATVIVGGAILIRKFSEHPRARDWAPLRHLPSRQIAA
ncbi:MAG: hypothetical protein KDE00_00495 [Rhodobacteraceae bacterium]|nr:hypothetical protein [Paracoccaceae bacterium]